MEIATTPKLFGPNIHTIDATKSIEEIHEAILEHIKVLLDNRSA